MSNTTNYICVGICITAIVLIYMALKSEFDELKNEFKNILISVKNQKISNSPQIYRQQREYVVNHHDINEYQSVQPGVVPTKQQVIHNTNQPKNNTSSRIPIQAGVVQEEYSQDQPGLSKNVQEVKSILPEIAKEQVIELDNIIDDYESEAPIIKRESPNIKDYDTIDSYQSKVHSQTQSLKSSKKKKKKKQNNSDNEDDEHTISVDTETKNNSEEIENMRDKLKKIKESSDDDDDDDDEKESEHEQDSDSETLSKVLVKKKSQKKDTISQQLKKVVKSVPIKRGRGRPKKKL